MAFLRTLTQVFFNPTPSPSQSAERSQDAELDNELVAVSENAVLSEAFTVTSDVDLGNWMVTEDFDSAAEDAARTDALSTSDADDQLNAEAERAGSRRRPEANIRPPSDNDRALTLAGPDMDNVLLDLEKNDFVAGKAHSIADFKPEPGVKSLLDQQRRKYGPLAV
jgi:hypothetical protein